MLSPLAGVRPHVRVGYRLHQASNLAKALQCLKSMGVYAPTSVHDMQVFDDYLQQLGEDTAAYVRTVCQTIVLTVPKAVIHCQVG